MEMNIRELLIDELHDILSAEEQIVDALPKMVAAAESPELKNAFATHLKETKAQIQRLTKIFKLLKIQKKEKFCHGMKGLIMECKEVLREHKTKSASRDAALISKAQRIEHYEISAYGTARTFAREIDLREAAALLKESLDEEANADKTLSKIAEGGLFKSGINYLANIEQPKAKPRSTTTAKISIAKRAAAKRSTAQRATAKRAATKRTTAHHATAKLSTAKRTAAKRTTAHNATAKLTTAHRAAAKRTTAKKSLALSR